LKDLDRETLGNFMSEAVNYSVSNQVAHITLNRPEVLNALNGELMLGLKKAIDQAAEDPQVRSVLLTGAGRGFSAGADLTSIDLKQAASLDLGAALLSTYNPIIEAMRAMPKPIVTAVNGSAAGAGMSIALAGDIVLAAESASFLQAFARLGLVPDAGSTWMLPRLVGAQRARALTLLAEPINAKEALEYGLIWKCYADAELLPAATKLAEKLARQATKGIGLIKEAMNASENNTLSEQLSLEAQLQSRAGKTSDFKEGVMAFLQKRPANYTGQ
jgi:2-(1,2-epoxy-1,2-dihydrophenyl)acetyl-CoA isomerase